MSGGHEDRSERPATRHGQARYDVPMPSGASIHTPVLSAEVMAHLELRPGMRVVDGTLGGGGHARLFADAVGPQGLVVGIDRDPLAI